MRAVYTRLMMARALPLVAALVAWSRPARAVRPFITDDARVVGNRAAQFETWLWLRFDSHGIQHWMIPGVGLAGPVEFSLGAVQGVQGAVWGAALPLVQLKVLALETKPGAVAPGVALVGGVFGPFGAAPLQLQHWDGFAYAAFSESLDAHDRILFHQNVGLIASNTSPDTQTSLTWGLGTQLEVLEGTCVVAEVFSGDPYSGKPSAAAQGGLRYFVSANTQVDATVGQGVWGESLLPLWGSVGLRMATPSGAW